MHEDKAPAKSADPGKDRIHIRASSLNSFAYCQRYFLAGRFEMEVGQAHPDSVRPPSERSGGYKPVMGTAIHKILERNIWREHEMREAADEAMEDHVEDPDFFDEKFENGGDIKDVIVAVAQHALKQPELREWTTERAGNKFEVELVSDELDSDYRLQGHVDLVRKDGQVMDIKTGGSTDSKMLYQPQLAAYRLLVEHQGIDTPDEGTIVKVNRPGSPRYRSTTLRVARYRVALELWKEKVPIWLKQAGDLVADFDKWKEDFTKVEASPGCLACQWCKLRNTSACPETKNEQE